MKKKAKSVRRGKRKQHPIEKFLELANLWRDEDLPPVHEAKPQLVFDVYRGFLKKLCKSVPAESRDSHDHCYVTFENNYYRVDEPFAVNVRRPNDWDRYDPDPAALHLKDLGDDAPYAIYHLVQRVCKTLEALGIKGGNSERIPARGGGGEFIVTKDGTVFFKLSAYSDKFAKALQGLALERIKRCEVCGNLFFAWNRTKRGCSAKHGRSATKAAFRTAFGESRQTIAQRLRAARASDRERGAGRPRPLLTR